MSHKDYYNINYKLVCLKKDLKDTFTLEEKEILRPIAETLALLDGNAFFGSFLANGGEWYEQYLPEANYLFEKCGGKNPHASWMQTYDDAPAVKEAWENFKLMKRLSKEKT